MTETPAKDEFQALVQQAVSTAATNNWPLVYLRSLGLYESSIQSFSSFKAAELAVTKNRDFFAKVGADGATQVALQFVREYFKRVNDVRYDGAAFDSLWLDFTAEFQQADWITRGIANVRNFESSELHVDLGDGVTIRGRIFEELASLGFDAPILEQISNDWSGFGASSFIMLAEEMVPKRPENLVSPGATSVWANATRAVGALRLAAAGDVSIGPMWVVRAARFSVGIGGLSRIGASIPALGSRYVWSEEVAQVYPSIYRELAQLDKVGCTRSPGNLDLALRSFMATYDRWPPNPDSKLIDAITSLEALLGQGSGTEITFKLAFRVAALLAQNDEERGALLRTMKEFYDTRSTLVHGGRLKPKHERRLARVDELRSLVRPLLRSFVAFGTTPPGGYDKSFFEGQLDAALTRTG